MGTQMCTYDKTQVLRNLNFMSPCIYFKKMLEQEKKIFKETIAKRIF